MQVFVSGTDTNIGKTVVCSWLCLHTGYGYFKPIQTGTAEGSDSSVISVLAGAPVYPETYVYKAPLSPHLASSLEHATIDLAAIKLPAAKNIIVEGAGGLLVPINNDYLMIDLIKQLQIPVILVASSHLGTINHTLLSLEALKSRNIQILGVIMSGQPNKDNRNAIEYYGRVPILAYLPFIDPLNKNSLRKFPLTIKLKKYLR